MGCPVAAAASKEKLAEASPDDLVSQLWVMPLSHSQEIWNL